MSLPAVLWPLTLKFLDNMLAVLDDKFYINRFVETQLPTKAQIFSRTGQRAVNPAGMYTGDDAVKYSHSKTESASQFVRDAESFESPKNEE